MKRFVGKSLLLSSDDQRLLALGDLHLGYDTALRSSGMFAPSSLLQQTIDDLTRVFKEVGHVDIVVLVGDVKHLFGALSSSEWRETLSLFSFMRTYADRIVIVRGNHDATLAPIAHKADIDFVDFYVWKGYVLVHGDRDFSRLHERDVHTWIVGHAHPAITLREGVKSEKYKCFLEGSYERKKIIVLPSFFPFSEGSDAIEDNLNLAWPFALQNFRVFVIEESMTPLDFGILKKIRVR